MTRFLILLALAASLGGCLHTVHYGNDSGAHWRATPVAADIR